MYKYCLCGTLYQTEKEVIRCINRCGRKLPDTPKDIPIFEVTEITLCGRSTDEEDFIGQMENELQCFRRAN